MRYILILIILLIGCTHKPEPVNNEVVIRFESEIPVKVSIYKSCEGNWNFCNPDSNHNFQKWD